MFLSSVSHVQKSFLSLSKKNKLSVVTNPLWLAKSVNITRPKYLLWRDRPCPIWNYPHRLFNHIALRKLLGLWKRDYIVLSGVSTTDLAEQSARADSRQDKLHRRLPLIYELGRATCLHRCGIFTAVHQPSHPRVSLWPSQRCWLGLELNVMLLLVQICSGYCKRTEVVVQCVLGNTLYRRPWGGGGESLFVYCTRFLCSVHSNCAP